MTDRLLRLAWRRGAAAAVFFARALRDRHDGCRGLPLCRRFVVCRAAVLAPAPLCPAGQGNSPYQSPGSFAGDAVYIDPQLLVESGYLQPPDLDLLPCGGDDRVDYPAVRRGRQVLFDRLFDRFVRHIPTDFDCFCQSQADWLEDYALFCALSERYGKRFFLWPSALRRESRRL